MFAKGTYSSPDVDDFDRGYKYDSKATPDKDEFINNATQGPFDKFWLVSPGTLTGPAEFGFGVHTTDGGFGAGTLLVNDLSMNVFPARVETFAWEKDLNGGSITFGPGNLATIVGGDDSSCFCATNTRMSVKALSHFTVEAECEYVAPPAAFLYDAAFYSVNGVATQIADNQSPGVYNVKFEVCCGDTFDFNVFSGSNIGGPGTLIIRNFRAWVLPECKGTPPCYADCDGSGTLNIDDFICFQTFFAIGDPYADGDGSGGLNIDDFICFQTFYALGC
jgi:hypothetical protein